jgi:hypothetical protein
MPAVRVCASPASFRLPSEAKPIRFGQVFGRQSEAKLGGFRRSAIGAKAKTARVRDPFSQPASSGIRPSQGVMKLKRL